MNISKTKRNFICWHTLFAVISAALGAVILHFALPGHYFGGYPFIPVYFYFFDSFADSGLDLLPCCTRRSQSFFTDVYLVLFDISDIRNLVFLLF